MLYCKIKKAEWVSGMLFEKIAAGRLPPQVRFPAVLTSVYFYALPAAVLEGFPGGTDLLPSVFCALSAGSLFVRTAHKQP